jgi:mediator of RNA polymerase II transcription subunit 14
VPLRPFTFTKDKIESQERPRAGAEEGGVVAGGSGRREEVLGQENMPGVIMENGRSNGAHTNHDRDTIPNGVNGVIHAADRAFDKGKGGQDFQQASVQSSVANVGSNGTILSTPTPSQLAATQSIPRDLAAQIQDLPPEILHITEGFESLSTLLRRLAEVTHTRLSNKVVELAAMPTPSSAMNGNGIHLANGPDDNSVDNIKKKAELLKFIEKTHADWTKALVITQWSRISEDVSKVIDLKIHLDKQRMLYDDAVGGLFEVKRSLVQARVPNPDIKTAVEILSTGKASWMPDVSRISLRFEQY